jgi:hypothetical protein
VHRGPLGAQGDELLLVHRGDGHDVEPTAHPLRDHRGAREGLLHRHLLVEDHPQQQGVVVLGQQVVGGRVPGQPDAARAHGASLVVPPVVATATSSVHS